MGRNRVVEAGDWYPVRTLVHHGPWHPADDVALSRSGASGVALREAPAGGWDLGPLRVHRDLSYVSVEGDVTGLGALAGLPHLTTVEFHNAVNRIDVSTLTQVKRLTAIGASLTGVTRLVGLQQLMVTAYGDQVAGDVVPATGELVELDLALRRVADRSVTVIAGLKDLQDLRITEATPAGLDVVVPELGSLRTLVLIGADEDDDTKGDGLDMSFLSSPVGHRLDHLHVEGHGLLTGVGVLADLAPTTAYLRPIAAVRDAIDLLVANGWVYDESASSLTL